MISYVISFTEIGCERSGRRIRRHLKYAKNPILMSFVLLLGVGMNAAYAGCVKSITGEAPSEMEERLHPAGVSMTGVSVGKKCKVKWSGTGQYKNRAGTGEYTKITPFGSIQVAENWFFWTGAQSPLLIDLQRTGFAVSPHGTGVKFDINGDGYSDSIQWVADGSDDGFLAHDINHNGYIDDGTELFGVGTDMLDGTGIKATDGYQALAQFDRKDLGGNADGVINDQDGVWGELSIWIDSNGDGISVPDEVTSVEKAGIIAMPLNYKVLRNRVDESGNWIPFWSWVRIDEPDGPGLVRMVDIFFLNL